MGPQDPEAVRPTAPPETPTQEAEGPAPACRHFIDLRFVTPRLLGPGRYFVLRIGKDRRDGPRPYTVPGRVRRRNRTVAALLLQMLAAWVVALVVLFAWLSQMGCGASAVGGEIAEQTPLPAAAAAESEGAAAVRASPLLSVSPTSLNFGAATVTLPLTIGNAGGGTLTWQCTGRAPYVTVSPASGTGRGTVNVTVKRDGLTAGTRTYSVTVTSNGGTKVVPVSFVVGAPLLGVSPTSLAFGTTATQLPIAITNKGTGTLTWQCTGQPPWITVSPTSGTGPATVKVTANRSGLTPATRTFTVMITSNGGSAKVSAVVVVEAPGVWTTPSSLDFGASTLGLSLTIRGKGGAVPVWTCTADHPWVSMSATSGTGAKTITVRVDRSRLAVGSYTSNLRISSNVGRWVVPIKVVVGTGGATIGVR